MSNLCGTGCVLHIVAERSQRIAERIGITFLFLLNLILTKDYENFVFVLFAVKMYSKAMEVWW